VEECHAATVSLFIQVSIDIILLQLPLEGELGLTLQTRGDEGSDVHFYSRGYSGRMVVYTAHGATREAIGRELLQTIVFECKQASRKCSQRMGNPNIACQNQR
jgi:hypothetical protein